MVTIMNDMDKFDVSEEAREWINRDMDSISRIDYDSLSKEEIKKEKIKRMTNIHNEFSLEATFLLMLPDRINRSDDVDIENIPCKHYMLMVFDAMKEVENKTDVELKIPFAWADQPMVDVEFITKVTNGLIWFERDESCEDCVRQDYCYFYNNECGKAEAVKEDGC